ncbi:MAG: PAS domain-containing protein [Sulfuricurvum sp.]
MGKVTPIDEEFVFEEGFAISQSDAEGIITYINSKFCEISGYTKEELIGSKHNIIKHQDTQKSLFERMNSTIHSGQTFNSNIKNLRKDGKYYQVKLEILPLLSSDGEVEGFISLSRPIDRKSI